MEKYAIVLICALCPLRAFSSEPSDRFVIRLGMTDEPRFFDSIDIQTPVAVSNAIEFLLCGQDPRHWLCGQQNERRDELSESIVSLSHIHSVPPLLLVVKFYLESRFNIRAIGKLGEIGISQVHGVAKRGCELDSAHGQMECGAVYLGSLVEACRAKTLQSAILVYISGKCNPSDKVRAIADYRLGIYFRLVKRTEHLYKNGILFIPEPLLPEPAVAVIEEESTPEEPLAIQPVKTTPALDIRAIVAAAREKAMREAMTGE